MRTTALSLYLHVFAVADHLKCIFTGIMKAIQPTMSRGQRLDCFNGWSGEAMQNGRSASKSSIRMENCHPREWSMVRGPCQQDDLPNQSPIDPHPNNLVVESHICLSASRESLHQGNSPPVKL